MNENPNRQPKGTPVGGQFAASAKAEAEAVTLSEPGADPRQVTLPGGAFHLTEATPDPDLTPLVKDMGDGTALVTYITHETFDSSGDPVVDATHTLRDQRGAEAIFSGDEYSADALDDYLQASGDNLLDRVAFLRRTEDGTWEAKGRSAVMSDWDEFKDYANDFDAAVVFPRIRVAEHDVAYTDYETGTPIRDYSQVADDIEEAQSGRLYTVHHEHVDIETGEVLATDEDDYDSQIFDADDAIARAESQHDDAEQTVEFMG